MEVSMSKTRRGKYTDNRICYISKCKGNMRLYLRRKGKLPCFSYLVRGKSFSFYRGKIGIPAAVVLGASGTGISYMTSANAIEQFEHTISLGEQQATVGEYGKALQLFSDAKSNYTASFRTGHYQDIADEHISSSVNDATQLSVKMIEEGKLMDASILLSSLPQKVISENQQFSEQYNSAKSTLDKAINEGLDNLISDILTVSANRYHYSA